MSDDLVLADVDAETGVATITINRPKVLNALDAPTSRAFLRAVREVTARKDVRCIVLRGAGRAFVAGGDVAAFGSDPDRAAEVVHELLDALHPALVALREAPAPVIAVVRGVAAGAGFSLVLGADLVVAETDARFVIAYDRIGTTPDCGGTWALPRKVGRAKAMELMLLGETLSAEEAKAAGIVNAVVAPDELDARADTLARRVSSGPTQAYGGFCKLIDAALERPFAAHLEAERASFIRMTETGDFREGVSAFLEKRQPQFRGE
ncbi:enoyl-CoA hydratase/isomerase family protein [Stappia sp.]|uniref:enoyl-CoA hydratase/isomerase family protein n=1 Tax=Stappia sp. TaxID=1870903 RepID=UPI003A9A3EE7